MKPDNADGAERRLRRLTSLALPFRLRLPDGTVLEGVTSGLNGRGVGAVVRRPGADLPALPPGLPVEVTCALPDATIEAATGTLLRTAPAEAPGFDLFLAVVFDRLPEAWQAYLERYIDWLEREPGPEISSEDAASPSDQVPAVHESSAPRGSGAIPDDLEAWLRDRVERRWSRVQQAAAEDGAVGGSDPERGPGSAVVRETCQLAAVARLAGIAEVAEAAERVAAAEPGRDLRERFTTLETRAGRLHETRPPTPGFAVVALSDPRARAERKVLLEEMGAAATEAPDAASAERLVLTLDPDLLLLDPAFGLDACIRLVRAARSRSQSLAIVGIRRKSPTAEDAVLLAEGADLLLDDATDPALERRILEARYAAARARRAESRKDAATGLVSRHAFCEDLERAILFTQRVHRPLSLILFKVRGLEEARERHGNEAAEALMALAADVVRGTLRSSDTVARWSRGLIAVSLPNTAADDARRAARKVLAAADQPVLHTPDHADLRLALAAGIAGVGTGTLLEDLVTRAHRKLEETRHDDSDPIRVEPDDRGSYRLNALVADGDGLTREVITHRFQREGYEVVSCEDGLDAIETVLFGAAIPTFFVIDLHLARINGLDLVRRLRAMSRHARTPILLLAVAGQEQRLAEGLANGANDYMVRPFSPLELMTRVRRLVRPT